MIFNLGGIAAAPKLTSIAVTTKPTTTTYTEGASFSTSGMVVTAYFEDGSSSAVTGYTYSPTTVPAGSVSNNITISYTRDGVTKTATVAVVGRRYLYNKGNLCTSITGGWQGRGVPYNSNYTATKPTVTKGSSTITAEFASNTTMKSGVLEVINNVNLTNFKKITAYFTSIVSSGEYVTHQLAYGTRSTSAISNSGAKTISTAASTVTNKTFTLDISSVSGSYDVYIALRTGRAYDSENVSGKVVMSYMYLE